MRKAADESRTVYRLFPALACLCAAAAMGVSSIAHLLYDTRAAQKKMALPHRFKTKKSWMAHADRADGRRVAGGLRCRQPRRS